MSDWQAAWDGEEPWPFERYLDPSIWDDVQRIADCERSQVYSSVPLLPLPDFDKGDLIIIDDSSGSGEVRRAIVTDHREAGAFVMLDLLVDPFDDESAPPAR